MRKAAEDVLAKIRAGGDFAALAAQYSEDEASRTRGGDLDCFPRGRMVPEFDQVVFSMQPGIVSDLVKTQYGFHIIKVEDKRAGSTRPLAEAQPQIQQQLAVQIADQQIADRAQQLQAQTESPA